MFKQHPFLLLFVSCSMCLLASCQSEPDNEGQCTINFSVTNYSQISFDDLSSSASTRATETITMDLANLLLTVFNAETNEMVCPAILHKSDDYDESNVKTFPQFSVTLPYGHYRVLVLGYNNFQKKQTGCEIASLNYITWDNAYVPNTFLYCEEFTLDEDASLNKEITLRHVVAAFRLETEDKIPVDIKKMRFISSAGGTVLDAVTGFTPESTGRTFEMTLPDENVGKAGMFTIYLFLPEEQATSNYTVQALGANDIVLYEKHFNDVPFRINYLTKWKGKLFGSSDNNDNDDPNNVQNGFSIKWDTKWGGELNVNP